MKKTILFFFLLSSLFGTLAFAQDRYAFSAPGQRQQFQRLTAGFRCMVCQNESLADSNSGFARDMRGEIYQMIKAGKTDKQITQYMVSRYSYFVSFHPPFNWETYLLWFAPLLLLSVATLIARSVYKKYRGA